MRLLIFILSFVIAFSSASFSFANEEQPSLARFQLDKPLTSEILEYFFKHPPNGAEYEFLVRNLADYGDVLDEIVCFGTKNHPGKVHEIFSAPFGSLSDHFIPVCQAYLLENKVPETKPLIDHMYKLSGIKTAKGTMWYTVRKELQFLRIAATTLPLREPNTAEKADDAKSSLAEFKATQAFLKTWSQQGQWENKQYHLLTQVMAESRVAMVIFYKKHLELNDAQSQRTADYYLRELLSEYLGRFPKG